MSRAVSDEARRLFAVVVGKCPELMPPGVKLNRSLAIPYIYDGSSYGLADLPEVIILAAAALCAKWKPDRRYTVYLTAHDDWVSAQFAAVLAEKGISYE